MLPSHPTLYTAFRSNCRHFKKYSLRGFLWIFIFICAMAHAKFSFMCLFFFKYLEVYILLVFLTLCLRNLFMVSHRFAISFLTSPQCSIIYLSIPIYRYLGFPYFFVMANAVVMNIFIHIFSNKIHSKICAFFVLLLSHHPPIHTLSNNIWRHPFSPILDKTINFNCGSKPPKILTSLLSCLCGVPSTPN